MSKQNCLDSYTLRSTQLHVIPKLYKQKYYNPLIHVTSAGKLYVQFSQIQLLTHLPSIGKWISSLRTTTRTVNYINVAIKTVLKSNIQRKYETGTEQIRAFTKIRGRIRCYG